MTIKVTEYSEGIWVATTDVYSEAVELSRAGWRRQRDIPGLRDHERGDGFWTNRRSILGAISHATGDEAVHKAVEDLEASYAASTDYMPPCPSGLAYYPFQRAGIELMKSRRNNLLGDQMGLGKSIQIVGLMNEWRPRRTLLIVPASLSRNWYKEVRKWTVWNPRTYIYKNTSTRPPSGVEVLIASYGQVSYSFGNSAKSKMHSDLMRWLAQGSSFVACDEAHKIKNPGARVTKAVRELLDASERRLLATGTPIMNRVTELFHLCEALDPSVLGDLETFSRIYCGHFRQNTRKVKRGSLYTFEKTFTASGVRNSDRLSKVVRSSLLVRRMKRDVMKELPPKIRQLVDIDDVGGHAARATRIHDRQSDIKGEVEALNEAKRQAEDDARDAFEAKVAELRDEEKRAIGEIARARSEHAEAKAPQVIEFAESVIEAEGCVVIMCVHHVLVDALRDRWPDAAVITGKTPTSKRQGEVDRFQGGKTSVFIGSIKAAGVGHTLTRSSHVVLAECEWTPADNEQAEDRCHRIGQDSDCVNAYYLVADDTIDARVANAMVSKAQVAREVLDRKEDDHDGQ